MWNILILLKWCTVSIYTYFIFLPVYTSQQINNMCVSLHNFIILNIFMYLHIAPYFLHYLHIHWFSNLYCIHITPVICNIYTLSYQVQYIVVYVFPLSYRVQYIVIYVFPRKLSNLKWSCKSMHVQPFTFNYKAQYFDCKCLAVLHSKESCFCEGWLLHILPVSINGCHQMFDSFACAHKFELFLL